MSQPWRSCRGSLEGNGYSKKHWATLLIECYLQTPSNYTFPPQNCRCTRWHITDDIWDGPGKICAKCSPPNLRQPLTPPHKKCRSYPLWECVPYPDSKTPKSSWNKEGKPRVLTNFVVLWNRFELRLKRTRIWQENLNQSTYIKSSFDFKLSTTVANFFVFGSWIIPIYVLFH